MESWRRSVAKALSWRAIATVVTVWVVWGATGEAALAATIGLVDTTVKLGAYYMHERAWNRVGSGRPRHQNAVSDLSTVGGGE